MTHPLHAPCTPKPRALSRWRARLMASAALIVGGVHTAQADYVIEGPTPVVVDGYDIDDRVVIGSNENGEAHVLEGEFISEGIILGENAGTVGTLLVSGPQADWWNATTTNNVAHIGRYGEGYLTIENGAVALHTSQNVNVDIGWGENSFGHVIVTGEGTRWEVRDTAINMAISSGSQGLMEILDGAWVGSKGSTIGWDGGASASAMVTVSGPGSTWEVSRDLIVARRSAGTLQISDQAEVYVYRHLHVGYDPHVNGVDVPGGVVEVSGDGTFLSVRDEFSIGRRGAGTVILRDGGRISVGDGDSDWIADGAGPAYIAREDTATGLLVIGAREGEEPAGAGLLEATELQFGKGDGTLLFNHNGETTFSTALVSSGNGTHRLRHVSGNTELTGLSSGFSGVTTVTGGRLTITGELGGTAQVNGGAMIVNGTFDGPVSVSSGGRLEGTGTVGAVTLGAGGIIAPGDPSGTLTVAGDLNFNPASTYEVEVDPLSTDSDLIHVTGQAYLKSASVFHVGAAGPYAPESVYTILTAEGGIVGTFGSVASNFAYLDPSLEYDDNNVYLRLTRNEADFCLQGMTENQCAVANGVQSAGWGNPVHDVIVGLSSDQAANAFNQLSGEIHASLKGGLIEESHFLRDAVYERIRSAFRTPASRDLPLMAYGPDGAGQIPVAQDVTAPGAWLHAYGSHGDRDSDGNADSFSWSGGGVLAGFDVGFADSWRAGVLAGYSQSSFDTGSIASSGSGKSWHLGVYGGGQWQAGAGAFGLRGGGAYSWHRIDTDRVVDFPGLSDRLTGAYKASTAQIFGEVAYGVQGQRLGFESFANVAHVSVRNGHFTEEGGPAALSGLASRDDVSFATIGLRASALWGVGDVDVTGRAMLGWQHAFGDVAPQAELSLLSGSDVFTIAGTPIAEHAALVEAGLDFGLGQAATLSIAYQGQFASDATRNAVNAALNFRF